MYLYLGNESVVVGKWIVDVISFQKIFGLCCLKCHIVEIWRDVTFEDTGRTDGNVNIVLESAKQDSQKMYVPSNRTSWDQYILKDMSKYKF